MFFGPETQLVVSKRFHLTIYRVLHEESESELKNDQILQPYAVFCFRCFVLEKIKKLIFCVVFDHNSFTDHGN